MRGLALKPWTENGYHHRFSRNSSGVTRACFKMPFSVPTANSVWSGTTQPTCPSGVCFFNITWLPLCLIWAKPSRSSARIACWPDTRRNLGTAGDLEGRQQRARNLRQGELFKVQFCSFFKIGYGFFDGMTLADSSHLGAIRNIQVVFSVDDSGQKLYSQLTPPFRFFRRVQLSTKRTIAARFPQSLFRRLMVASPAVPNKDPPQSRASSNTSIPQAISGSRRWRAGLEGPHSREKRGSKLDGARNGDIMAPSILLVPPLHTPARFIAQAEAESVWV